MKLSIRLQNHGRKNHPLWWIVVAPNRKNIFGRYIEHVGYWSPRHGLYLQRQIVLNIPRIKYWMSCGAVPTFKVHKFLSLWNILPAPWYYKKSEQQRAKELPQGEQLTDKKKRKMQMKERIKARQVLNPQNYYKQEARLKFMVSWKRKFEDLKRTQERQNQILRDMLLHNEFKKIAKINELSGKTTFTHTEEINKLKESLKKAKSELAFIRKNAPTTSAFEQTKTIKLINDIANQLRKVQVDKQSSIMENLQKLENQGEYMTEDMLKTKLEYELVTKKIEKNLDELEDLTDLTEPVLLQEYADFLVEKTHIDPEQAYVKAQKQFTERGFSGTPVIKYELKFWDQIQKFQRQEEQQVIHPDFKDADLATILKKAVEVGDLVLPVRRSVHPEPDLQSYIPEDYYEPLMNHDFKIRLDDPLSPYQELQKYHEKKKKSSLVV